MMENNVMMEMETKKLEINKKTHVNNQTLYYYEYEVAQWCYF
jgi:hypothetical protein